MDWGLVLILMLGSLVALLAAGLPVAFAFIVVNTIGAYFVFGGEAGLVQMVRNSVSSLTSFVLLPIPLFILMGEIMFQSGVAQRAIGAIDRAITHVPARLSVVTIAGGSVFAALSGSSIANTALLGNTLMPEMLRRGYHPTLAMGPILASGAIAVLIPPSALAVLLGSMAKISIAQLLVAGIVPALIMAVGFLAIIMLSAWMRPQLAPTDDLAARGMRERLMPLIVDVLPLSAILIAVVGSLLAGLATPTESAAFGCVASLVVAIFYRSVSLLVVKRALMATVHLSTTILFIVAASQTFSQILAFTGATQDFVAAISGVLTTPGTVMFGVILVLLVLGCFVDPISMMMLTLPLVMPLAQHVQLDLLVLATAYLLTMEIGLLTPPVGLLLFVMKGIAPPEIRMRQIYAAIAPFLAVKLLVLLLIVTVPPVVHWLPRFVGR
ncbi:TRAP transporter large permease [Chelativorans alearense]|uniref:TRAP transporter large permease n=1 Tax=Chelativorans alearense TaxID=2681495 RepID=UPI0013D2CC47|nr:TRAP transporter large permease [Chelativorans alearense]